MAISDREFEAFVAAVTARLASGALGLARIWSGFAARLRKAFRDERDDIVRIIEAQGRATGQESGRILNASVGDAGGLGRSHVRRILEVLTGREPSLPGFEPPDLGPYADEVARDVVARLRESFRTWKDQDHAEEQIVQLTGEHLDRLLTGNQTEGFRQYRRSLMAGYRAVPEVDRIVRRERLDSLTCAVCWALDGEILDKSEDIAVHPNCRGIPVPLLVGADPRRATGPQVFEELSSSEQQEILGKTRFEMYERGELRLADVVHRGQHPEFGPFVRMRTLKEMEGARIDAAPFDEVLTVVNPNRVSVKMHLDDLAKLPETTKRLLADQDVRFIIGEGDIVDLPGGQRLGPHRRSVPGAYVHEDEGDSVRTAWVGSRISKSVSVALHEAGHAVGYLTDGHRAPRFMEAFYENWDRLPPYYQDGGKGKLEDGAKETFAEIFASILKVGRSKTLSEWPEEIVDLVEPYALGNF